jgi:hypothetical protein
MPLLFSAPVDAAAVAAHALELAAQLQCRPDTLGASRTEALLITSPGRPRFGLTPPPPPAAPRFQPPCAPSWRIP